MFHCLGKCCTCYISSQGRLIFITLSFNCCYTCNICRSDVKWQNAARNCHLQFINAIKCQVSFGRGAQAGGGGRVSTASVCWDEDYLLIPQVLGTTGLSSALKMFAMNEKCRSGIRGLDSERLSEDHQARPIGDVNTSVFFPPPFFQLFPWFPSGVFLQCLAEEKVDL